MIFEYLSWKTNRQTMKSMLLRLSVRMISNASLAPIIRTAQEAFQCISYTVLMDSRIDLVVVLPVNHFIPYKFYW